MQVNKMIRLVFLPLGLFQFSSTLFAGSMVSANKDDVNVTAEPSKDGKVLATLKKGDTVDSFDRQGMYWKVKLPNGKDGFVSVLSVRPKSGDSNSLAKAIQRSVKEGRSEDEVSNTRARSAVMGVRGFDEDEKIALIGNVRPNLRMVYRMEDRIQPKKTIDKLGNMVFSEVEKRSEDSID